IDADRPDLVLWLGDNGYFEHADSVRPADYEDPARMQFRYAQLRSLETLQPLLRHVPHYAIWDARDYDGSDSDRTNPLREEVTGLFERFWANPYYGEDDGSDGIYSSFRIADVEVFLIDDRFFRDPDSLPDSPSKTVLGAEQKAWLKEGLVESDARLKVVAIGHQVLADYHEWESYAMFAHERDELLDWIRTNRIDGVVFVDGDRHLTELMRWEPAVGYPIFEFTSSPVANRWFEEGLEIPNPIRIDGYTASPSYGVLEIDTTIPEGRLAFVARDTLGNETMRHEVALSELTFEPRAPDADGESEDLPRGPR
ncbi:MAG: alkaline phosphatase D family protein, partial [Halobacteriales archaeon]|nr:alkaline phosphatase D family protein [Halobacteriales archaeon]